MALIQEKQGRISFKKLVVLHVLINPDQTYSLKTTMKRAKNRLNPFKANGAMTQGEWADHIVENAEYPVSQRTAQNVLTELREKNCLKKVDERPGSNKPQPLYKVDRGKIYDELVEGEVSEKMMEFWYDILMTTGKL